MVRRFDGIDFCSALSVGRFSVRFSDYGVCFGFFVFSVQFLSFPNVRRFFLQFNSLVDFVALVASSHPRLCSCTRWPHRTIKKPRGLERRKLSQWSLVGVKLH
jgi:hypothetical protein